MEKFQLLMQCFSGPRLYHIIHKPIDGYSASIDYTLQHATIVERYVLRIDVMLFNIYLVKQKIEQK